jgi:hypothetical protein
MLLISLSATRFRNTLPQHASLGTSMHPRIGRLPRSWVTKLGRAVRDGDLPSHHQLSVRYSCCRSWDGARWSGYLPGLALPVELGSAQENAFVVVVGLRETVAARETSVLKHLIRSRQLTKDRVWPQACRRAP